MYVGTLSDDRADFYEILINKYKTTFFPIKQLSQIGAIILKSYRCLENSNSIFQNQNM